MVLPLSCSEFILRQKDFFRYSEDALKKLFKETGFREVKIEYIGQGPFVAAYSQIEYIFPRIFRPILFLIIMFLDKIICKLVPNLKSKYPIGFLFLIQK